MAFDYPAPEREAGIVGHMNDDHADALQHYAMQAGMALPDAAPVMTAVRLAVVPSPASESTVSSLP